MTILPRVARKRLFATHSSAHQQKFACDEASHQMDPTNLAYKPLWFDNCVTDTGITLMLVWWPLVASPALHT
jgi:uncharacterized YccA/Bax inhibitor family protein